ncbi:MAG: leucyl/phenylalanyl-tRNA--protein transferase [Treponema sp.]|nr:leucyl/phenylalanyl-tRNA--protein transferase [Treponema sp.]
MSRRLRPGPDPLFPYLDETQRYPFPDPASSRNGIVAVGGNLSPGMLLSAYEQGLFPWYNPEDPVLWQSPDPRFVIFPETLRISASMRKLLRQGVFTITFDRDFPAVIRGCAETERPGQNGTWISADIIEAYTQLHRLGWAHSAESWLGGELAGGCYGIRMGKVFFGESMFAKKSNASKAAFLSMARSLFDEGLRFIDCQIPTEHLRSLGGREMSRAAFLKLLRENLSGSGPGPED